MKLNLFQLMEKDDFPLFHASHEIEKNIFYEIERLKCKKKKRGLTVNFHPNFTFSLLHNFIQFHHI